MVANRLNWYLNKNLYDNANQSGFCQNRSCLDNASRLFFEAKNSLNSGLSTIAIFLDFQRAFDLVWIDGLLMKLLTYNINGNMAKFIGDFLKNRSSCVKVGNSFSDEYSSKNGIPQGCVLSPLLFKIFINDFPNLNVNTSTSLFADDSSIWRSGNSPLEIGSIIQKDLDIIEKWCYEWGVNINPSKTTALLFTRRRKVTYPDLVINKEIIPFVSSFNFLGFIFDQHLTWREHILNIESRCLKRINLLRCITGLSWGASKSILLSVYKGLIRSILDYGSILFSCASKTLLAKLDSIQYKSLSICVGSLKGTPLSSIQFECEESPLAIRRSIASLKYMVKVACIPNYNISDIFQNIIAPCTLSNPFLSFNNSLRSFLITYNLHLILNEPNLYPPSKIISCQVDFSLLNLKSTNDMEPKSSYIYKYLNKYYNNNLFVYTDASKNKNNNVGISICIPALKSYTSYRLSDYMSLLAAELFAIYKAMLISHSLCSSKILIISDSLISLKDIYFGSSRLFPELLNNILLFINTSYCSFSFCYVPGHVGFSPHDVADAYARKASCFPAIDIALNLKFHEMYDIIEKHFTHEWLRNYQFSETGKEYLKFFHPPFHASSLVINKFRRKDTIYNRLRLQYCKNNYYLYKIGVVSSPMCDLCLLPDTVEHLLVECFKRAQLAQWLNSRLPRKRSRVQFPAWADLFATKI